MILHLPNQAIEELLELSETGMGFQVVRPGKGLDDLPLLVLNGEHAIQLRELDAIGPDDIAGVLRNGIRSLRQDNFETTTFTSPTPSDFELIEVRVPASTTSAKPATSTPIVLSSTLVKRTSLSTNRIFYRFSAYSPDRRVDPVTGNFSPGTYATTDNDEPHVPSGLAAVGRYALPTATPASYRYEIEAPKGQYVEFGTVAPAFGQAGGGVEALFRSTVVNQASPSAPKTMPDE